MVNRGINVKWKFLLCSQADSDAELPSCPAKGIPLKQAVLGPHHDTIDSSQLSVAPYKVRCQGNENKMRNGLKIILTGVLALFVTISLDTRCVRSAPFPTPISDPVYHRLVRTDNQLIIDGQKGYLYENLNGVYAGVSVSSQPQPRVVASIEVPTGHYAAAEVSISYLFEAVGLPGAVDIAISSQGGYYIRGFPPKNEDLALQAVAQWSLETLDGRQHFFGEQRRTDVISDLEASFESTKTFQLQAGIVYRIRIDAWVTAESDFPYSGKAGLSAWVDPIITIITPNYVLNLSDDIGNSALATPLPPAGLLFVSGATLAFAARRRRINRGRS